MNDKKEEQSDNSSDDINTEKADTDSQNSDLESTQGDDTTEDLAEKIEPVVVVKEAGEETEEEQETEEIPAKKAVGVRLRRTGPLLTFWDNGLQLKQGMEVVVEAERGLALGRVVKLDLCEKMLKQIPPELRVVRIADKRDQLIKEENENRNKQGYNVCLQAIEKLNLPMKLIEVEYQHSANKAIFYFSADGRVDFRELVKNMAQELRIRVEMRQIGIRDEARLVGGIGPCGQPTCCSTFLVNFSPVSIRQAKEQNLTLNPEKVSGLCGRLMCCLGYESYVYKDMQAGLPKIGKKADTWMGKGRVLEINIFSKIMRMELENREYVSVNIDDFRAWKEDADGFMKVLKKREQDERNNALDNAVSRVNRDKNTSKPKSTSHDKKSPHVSKDSKARPDKNRQKPADKSGKSVADKDRQKADSKDKKTGRRKPSRGYKGKKRGGRPSGKAGNRPDSKQGEQRNKPTKPGDKKKPQQRQGEGKPTDRNRKQGKPESRRPKGPNKPGEKPRQGEKPASKGAKPNKGKTPDPIRRRKLNTDKAEGGKKKYGGKPYRGKNSPHKGSQPSKNSSEQRSSQTSNTANQDKPKSGDSDKK